MKDTKIEWCDSTVNPTMGCDGCELWSPVKKTCYTGVQHDVLGRAGRPGWAPKFSEVTEFPGRMAKAALWSDLHGTDRPNKPWLNGYPRTIFISDMSDALSARVSFEYLKREIIDVVNSAAGRRHIWIWLTKRPHRMAKFDVWLQERGIDWPVHLWAMASVTSQRTADTRIHELLKVRAAVRGLSVEPMLGAVDLGFDTFCIEEGEMHLRGEYRRRRNLPPHLDWVICGGESGRGALPMHPDWPRSLRDQCRQAGTPFFFKQWGEHLPDDQRAADGTIADEMGRPEQLVHLGGVRFAYRVGKHMAGHLLDGITWQRLPDLTNQVARRQKPDRLPTSYL